MKIVRWIENLNEAVGKAVSWLSAILVLIVCLDVIIRRFIGGQATWVMELEWHLFALIFLLGAAYTLKNDRHVRVDLFYANFSKRDKALVNLFGTLLFLLPWTAILIYFSFQYGKISWLVAEKSPDPGGLPARYVVKFCITLGFLLLFLQGVAEALKALSILRSPTEKAPE